MWKKPFLVVIAATAFLMFGAGGAASAQTLNIGDPAPQLVVKEFVKGSPVTQFKPGSVYVVEFWATWCGPCKTSIPHLTELQKKYGDKVTFVGVSVWERIKARSSHSWPRWATRWVIGSPWTGCRPAPGATRAQWQKHG
jgi:thiol-disulfide isomerase/thioredoxin